MWSGESEFVILATQLTSSARAASRFKLPNRPGIGQPSANYFAVAPLLLFCPDLVGWVKQPLKLGVADLKPDYEPGSFGFDPLGLYPKVSREVKRMSLCFLVEGFAIRGQG